MKKLLALAFLLGAMAQAQFNGLGSSTPTCVDKDGDGYGVGAGCTGVDADDRDPAVHSTAQALSKWGTVAAYYIHMGQEATAAGDAFAAAAYNPTRYWVVSPSGAGSCSAHTFAANPDPTAVTACSSINTVNASVAAGDMVIFRGGTYQPGIELDLVTSGTAAHPIIYIAYPGEKPLVDFQNTSGFVTVNTSYVTFDGINVTKSGNAGYAGGTYYGGPPYTVTGPSLYVGNRFRNLEVTSSNRGMITADGISDLIIEDCSFHDMTGTHDVYLGGRSNVSDNVKVRRSLFYKSGSSGGTGTAMQFNGRVTNLLVEANFGYSNYLGCWSFEQGVSNSIVRNNVCWQNGKSGVVFSDYDSGACYDASGNPSNAGTYGICPWPQKNNLIENNTFYIGTTDRDGNPVSNFPCVTIADSSSTGPHDYSGNIFRNNVCQNDSGGVFFTIGQTVGSSTDQRASLLQMMLQNNTLYSSTGGNGNNVLRDVTAGGTYYTWDQLGLITGYSVIANQIAAASPFTTLGTYLTPSAFDLRLKPTSPAVNSGTQTGAPTYDVIGHQRSVTPSIGAYQYPSGGTSIPLNTWTTVAMHGPAMGANGWDKMVYARSAKKSLLYGWYKEPNSEPNDAIGGYDFETNRWDVIDPHGFFHDDWLPEDGHNQAWAYDHSRGVVEWTCCGSGSNVPENLYHTFWYDPVGQVGRDVQPASPKVNVFANYQGTATFDSSNDKMVYYNGHTWTYNPTTNVWTDVSSPTCVVACPSSLYNVFNAAIDFDSANGLVYLFGGSVSGTNTNDIYTFNTATSTWTKLAPSGTLPAARMKHGFVYDSLNNVFIMWGGENGSILNDTWVFDPTASSGQGSWTQLSPSVFPTGMTSSSWERMVYDSDHNAVLLWTNVNATNADGNSDLYGTSLKLWAFRYGGPGPNIGSMTGGSTATTGSINVNGTGWAKEPVLAVNGTTLYSAWSEYGVPSDNTSTSGEAHIFAKSYSSSTWNNLFTSSTSISSESIAGSAEAHLPALAVVNGTPWISYSVGAFPAISARFLTGSSTWTGGPIGIVNNVAGVYQSRSAITGVGTTPYMAFIEVDKSGSVAGQQHLVYVKHWNGSSWVQDGTRLNRDFVSSSCSSNCTIATSVAIASDGSNPIVAWTEYLTNTQSTETIPKLYVSQWNGSSWIALGSALNVSTSNWVNDVALNYFGGKIYLSWTERTATGVAKLYVKSYSSGTWSSILGGAALNRDATTGWAYHPALTNDGTNLFVGWVEQQSIGQRAQVYVSRWNGSSWTQLGTSLNADSTLGSSKGVSMAILSGQPVAMWAEVKQGSFRNVYLKQWNGSLWNSIGGTVIPPVTYTLSVTTSGTGSGITTGAGTYNSGDTATITQSANVGSQFTGWSGACSGTGSCTVTMNANKTVNAQFDLIPNNPKSVHKGGKYKGVTLK